MRINMSHGGGGSVMADLIDTVFKRRLDNPLLRQGGDAAILNLSGSTAFTTDSFVVQPLFFPGGDIGELAVCGTVNDLLTAGATPQYLSAAFVLEEGLEIETLERVVDSMARAAAEAGVSVVTGDTKVVEGRGGLIINTAGISAVHPGHRPLPPQDGDAILLSGTLGEHHAAILSARMGVENDIRSDCAPLNSMVRSLLDAGVAIRAMRDATRGGLGTVLHELSHQYNVALELDASLPVSPAVRGFCSILGLDPLYMGNEGKMVFLVAREDAQKALGLLRASPYGENAAIIGRVAQGCGASIATALGGRRTIRPLAGEGLPRIC